PLLSLQGIGERPWFIRGRPFPISRARHAKSNPDFDFRKYSERPGRRGAAARRVCERYLLISLVFFSFASKEVVERVIERRREGARDRIARAVRAGCARWAAQDCDAPPCGSLCCR